MLSSPWGIFALISVSFCESVHTDSVFLRPVNRTMCEREENMKRKVISLVLSFMMVLTLTPAMAFAQSPADGGGDTANAAAEKTTVANAAAAKGAGENLSVDFSVEQSAINERNVTVKIPELQNLIQSGSFDSINVDAKMSYGSQVVRDKTFTKKASDFQGGEDSFQVEFSDFGKWNVDVTFVKDGAAVFQGSKTVPVIAETITSPLCARPCRC